MRSTDWKSSSSALHIIKSWQTDRQTFLWNDLDRNDNCSCLKGARDCELSRWRAMSVTNILSHHNLVDVRAWSDFKSPDMQDGESSYLRVLVDMLSTVPDESYGLHAGVRKWSVARELWQTLDSVLEWINRSRKVFLEYGSWKERDMYWLRVQHRQRLFSIPHPATTFGYIPPSRPTDPKCLSRSHLVIQAVFCVTFVTCNFLIFIPHPAVNFTTIRIPPQNGQIPLLPKHFYPASHNRISAIPHPASMFRPIPHPAKSVYWPFGHCHRV